ncbi:MAG: hypothetical protein NTX22_05725 [Ignavibacteriales bacterium]|nr:hypothetical protein [Ignavibacteriales bacterium]
MVLTWNEIRKRAIDFVKEWENETREHAEAKTFWDSFFNIFGITRRRIASFEEPVKQLNKEYGFIDLFWKSNLIVEHKSKGKSLDKAYSQALAYFGGIKEEELPKYVIVSDFSRFRLYDIDENTYHEFNLKDLPKNIHKFGFILGYQKKVYKDEDPVNILAAEKMGKLHDALLENGYSGHQLEVFLVRLLFCLFADDTGIFTKDSFHFYLENKTKIDGSDLGMHLGSIFDTLNKDYKFRQKNLDEDLAAFPYVNGKLFEEFFPVPSFDSKMRKALLECASFDWSKISPAIFGSMFQSVMDKEKRRNLGAHYTSEKNILKVVKGLFLDELHKEFEECKGSIKKLEQFHEKISKLKFLDPACGCGNFLIITYREIRLLEIEILKRIHKPKAVSQLELNVQVLSKIDVDAMYGIEFEEFPARIAEVAIWLIDHQCNMKLSEEFGQYFVRLPLKKSPHIIHGNALRLMWEDIIPKTELSYILGNPPFVGKKEQNENQKIDMDLIFSNVQSAGILDYVTSWYVKAARYIQNTNIKVAFVSTNSISQGEQVSILWKELFSNYKIKIHFAHRTFKWNNEAKGNAQVHVVIIGFANYDNNYKLIYDYDTPRSDAQEIRVKNINPYLVEGSDFVVSKRNNPICNVPVLNYGSMAIDDGHFIFSNDEKEEFLKSEPEAAKFFRQFTGGLEFLNNILRWCLWLEDIQPSEIRNYPFISKIIKAVKEYRLSSNRAATKKLANYPYMFGEIRQPKTNYVLIPKVSSEFRKYIPLGIYPPSIIASGSCLILPNSNYFHFGVLSSMMHTAWMKYTCGRLESRFQYSNTIVYNNFPWPENPTDKQNERVEKAVSQMLSVREKYFAKGSSLADLYDPVAMPKDLVDAHKEIDDAVDNCYRKEKFTSELQRLEYLFDLYKKYTQPLVHEKKKGRK